jgi:hypothetical protein
MCLFMLFFDRYKTSNNLNYLHNEPLETIEFG